MWCPSCASEYREGITSCASCGVDLVAEPPAADDPIHAGPLTGRPVEENETGEHVLAAIFVTMDEAHAAVRALSDAGIASEVSSRDEPFPMTVSTTEPAVGVTVAPLDLPRARTVLRSEGLLTVAVARFRREEEAHAAVAALEAAGLKPRLSEIILEEVPVEFREDMEPYIVEVPEEQEGAAGEILEKSVVKTCDSCGAQIQSGDTTCSRCGVSVPA
jgi:hypothetical protein